MDNLVRKISNSFLDEALASPRMLEDLAAMERYMAESYDGRTLIELLQNADDAGAKRLIVRSVGSSLVVANDGRPFSEQDLISICRSGSSSKRRGQNIGYRGVGFKSATTISSEIIIHSAGMFFTFSKRACAEKLGVDERSVPTVRVPFPVDLASIPNATLSALDEYKGDGFTTFFIFTDPKLEKINKEFLEIDEGWLLFLRNTSTVDIICGGIAKVVSIKRSRIDDNESLVKGAAHACDWYVVSNKDTSVAFQCDAGSKVVPCGNDDAVFHCFMPTLDKTGYSFKVSADFSTDPSRKHIIQDSSTAEAMKSAQELIARTVVRLVKEKNPDKYAVVSLLGSHTVLSPLATQLESGILANLEHEAWIPLSNGGFSKPQAVKMLPRWLQEESGEISALEEMRPERLVDSSFIDQANRADLLLSKLGVDRLSVEKLSELLSDRTTALKISASAAAKIVANYFRASNKEDACLSCLFVPLRNGIDRVKSLRSTAQVAPSFLDELKACLNEAELESLSLEYDAFCDILKKTRHNGNASAGSAENGAPDAPIVNRWKTPLQNAIAIEASQGAAVKKTAAKCQEYDAISTQADGNVSYIVAKNVAKLGDSFSLSEAQYDAARIHADYFKVYLFAVGASGLEYACITNPVANSSSEKVVKEWEWVFNGYHIDEQPGRDEQGDVTSDDSSDLPCIDVIDAMDGRQFERCCARILIRNGYENVSLTKATGDQGIDILAHKDGVCYGIQCKCYYADLDNTPIQEACAGKEYYGCNIVVVMTNRSFTHAAVELAQRNNVVLWDRQMLLRMLTR